MMRRDGISTIMPLDSSTRSPSSVSPSTLHEILVPPTSTNVSGYWRKTGATGEGTGLDVGAIATLGEEGCAELAATAFCRLTGVADSVVPLAFSTTCPETLARTTIPDVGVFDNLNFEPVVGKVESESRGNVFVVISPRFVCKTSSSGKGGGKKLNSDSGSDVRLMGNSKTLLSSSRVGELAMTGKEPAELNAMKPTAT